MHDRCSCFLFQAEDGIRDLVRSRGLGDVYKRQGLMSSNRVGSSYLDALQEACCYDIYSIEAEPVSYTHLTLPTSDLV